MSDPDDPTPEAGLIRDAALRGAIVACTILIVAAAVMPLAGL